MKLFTLIFKNSKQPTETRGYIPELFMTRFTALKRLIKTLMEVGASGIYTSRDQYGKGFERRQRIWLTIILVGTGSLQDFKIMKCIKT